MNCPYNKFELQIAIISAANKLEAYEKEHGEGSVEKKMEGHPLLKQESQAEINAAVAAFNGVSVETLVSSPNMQTLVQAYAADIFRQAREVFEKEFGFDDKEAWAILVQSQLGL